jgi:hypothetical protein
MPALDRKALDSLVDGGTAFAVITCRDDDGTAYIMHAGRCQVAVSGQGERKCLSLSPDTLGACFEFDCLEGTVFHQGEEWEASFFDDADAARLWFGARIESGARVSCASTGLDTHFID